MDHLTPDSRFALGIADKLRPEMERLGALLPDGTDFGIMILVPVDVPDEPDLIVAMTTDRRRVAFAVGQWCLEVMHEYITYPRTERHES